MKIIFVILVLYLLNVFGVYQCIDSKFERKPRPIDQVYNVELEIDGQTFTKEIRCEHYYDAMCAARGNFWSIREVGAKSQYQSSKMLYKHPLYKLIEFPVPVCLNMVENKDLVLNHLLPKIDGKTHWITASAGKRRTYKTSRNAPNSEAVVVELTVKINGVEVPNK